jgi:hypothetical protein
MVIQTSFQSSRLHFVPNFSSYIVNLILLVVYVMYWGSITNMEIHVQHFVKGNVLSFLYWSLIQVQRSSSSYFLVHLQQLCYK